MFPDLEATLRTLRRTATAPYHSSISGLSGIPRIERPDPAHTEGNTTSDASSVSSGLYGDSPARSNSSPHIPTPPPSLADSQTPETDEVGDEET